MTNETSIYPLNIDTSYLKLPAIFFKNTYPELVSNPNLLLYNDELGEAIGLPYTKNNANQITQLLSGNEIPENVTTLAQAYAGHQFGHFNKLGDGRAVLIGEHITPDNKRIDIQLKGAGRTTFSRSGDGRATLSSMLREYLMSEAMNFLTIPTTRSLAVVATGDIVHRQQPQRGAVLTRIASSHIRVGTFEYAYQMEGKEALKKLADYTINRHFTDLKTKENPYLSFVEKVMELQIDLVVNWMRVGFIHGVMNTDNVSIPGETIDYGPCAFMNTYDPKTVFSSIDTQGRYAFGNQPKITHWNLTCFAGALLPLIHENEKIAIDQAQQLLNTFPEKYQQAWNVMMLSKLGLTKQSEQNMLLIDQLLSWMETNKADYTNTFLDLQITEAPSGKRYDNVDFKTWHSNWLTQLKHENKTLQEAQTLMKQVNPAFIPRNHQVEKALAEASEDLNFDLFNTLLKVLKTPYSYSEEYIHFTVPPADDDLGYQTFCGT